MENLLVLFPRQRFPLPSHPIMSQMLILLRIPRSITFSLLLIGLFVGCPSGCKREQLEQLAQQVKESTLEKLDQVAGPIAVPSSGLMKLQITNPVESQIANSRLITFTDGRSNVLQIRSYTDLESDEFPKILIQANTTASQVGQLPGQTLQATIYITPSRYLPIWSCMDQSIATLNVTSVQDGLLKASIKCDSLISTEGKSSPLSGTIEAVIPTPKVAQLTERL